MAGLHRPAGDGLVGIDHVHICPLRAALHRYRRHHDGVAAGLHLQPHGDEGARPQRQPVIGEAGAQADGAGGGVHLVVQHRQDPVVQYRRLRRGAGILRQRQHFRRPFGHGGGHRLQALLRQGELHQDRPQRGDDRQPGGIGGVHDVAGIDLPEADPAIDRRGDGGVGNLGAGAVDLRLIGLHLRFQLRHQGAGGVQLLRRGIGGGGELGVAGHVQPGVGEGGLVLLLFGHRLIERGLIAARVDPRQHVAGAHVLAFPEADLDQRPVHHRLDGDGGGGLHGAEALEIDGHVAQAGGRDQHRNAVGRDGDGRCGTGRGARMQPPVQAAGGQQQAGQKDQQTAHVTSFAGGLFGGRS